MSVMRSVMRSMMRSVMRSGMRSLMRSVMRSVMMSVMRSVMRSKMRSVMRGHDEERDDERDGGTTRRNCAQSHALTRRHNATHARSHIPLTRVLLLTLGLGLSRSPCVVFSFPEVEVGGTDDGRDHIWSRTSTW